MVTKEEMLRSSSGEKTKTNSKHPFEKRGQEASTKKEGQTLTLVEDQGWKNFNTPDSDYGDDWWSSDENTPETWEKLTNDTVLNWKTQTNKKDERRDKDSQGETKESQS